MWSKITSKNDIERLNENSILVKYPIDGSKLDSFENATNENVLFRRVISIDKEMSEVVLSPVIGKLKLENICSGFDGYVFSDIKKPLDSLCTENVWWLLNEDRK